MLRSSARGERTSEALTRPLRAAVCRPFYQAAPARATQHEVDVVV